MLWALASNYHNLNLSPWKNLLRRNRRPLKTWNTVGFWKRHIQPPQMHSFFFSAAFAPIAHVHSVQLFNERLYEHGDFSWTVKRHSIGVRVGMWKNRYISGWGGQSGSCYRYFMDFSWSDSLWCLVVGWQPQIHSTPNTARTIVYAGSGFSSGPIKKAEFSATKSESFF